MEEDRLTKKEIARLKTIVCSKAFGEEILQCGIFSMELHKLLKRQLANLVTEKLKFIKQNE